NEVLQNTDEVIRKIKEVFVKSESQVNKEDVESNELSHPSPQSGEGQGVRETSTMPGYAGSSWYFLRYMDPNNENEFCDRKACDYWNQVDLYIGGTEHAVGHLLYSRMWTKVLFDLGLIGFDEPFRKLLNQGMITGKSFFFNVENDGSDNLKITSYTKDKVSNVLLRLKYGHQFVDNNGKLLKKIFYQQIENGLIEETPYKIDWQKDGDEEYVFVKEESEKMSKSKFNVDNPDELCEKYGADTFRMYEMFLGPVEASKPWDTKGIEGVHRFLRKLWRLFFDDIKGPIWTSSAPSPSERAGGEVTDAELKILHRTIKKIEEDTERFSFNTAVSTFMICVNELADMKCHKKEILEKLLILLTPYAPHISEELWSQLGNEGSVLDAAFPAFNAALLVESTKEYPVSINGKLRTNIELALNLEQKQVEEIVLQNEIVQKWLEGKAPKKIIFVKNKMINVVI
ncbi:MAG: class I tRNA ligase family protein, partial [Ferruginibacter sp.]